MPLAPLVQLEIKKDYGEERGQLKWKKQDQKDKNREGGKNTMQKNKEVKQSARED